jgi:hypothetical protein
MQTRVSFNAGEFAPEMRVRSDIDYYQRGCLTLENWELDQMGGIKRRKGMRKFAVANSKNSRLVPFVYSYAEGSGLRFLVEIDQYIIKVWNEDGKLVKAFRSGVEINFSINLQYVKYKQINDWLIITSPSSHPLILEYSKEQEWTLKEFEWKERPWRFYEDRREHALTIESSDLLTFDVKFHEDEEALETELKDNDILRASYWTEQQEASQGSTSLRAGVEIVTEVPSSAQPGQRFAIRGEESVKYYSTIKDFEKSELVDGLDMPANYTSAFLAAEDLDGFEDVAPVSGLKEYFASHASDSTEPSKIKKGAKVAIRMSYWYYYTCVQEFNERVIGRDSFEDYQKHFVSGIPVGEALPCRSEWVFFCSGAWYGSYEVRRNYETDIVNAEWESRGISFSRNESISNTQISGTESDEECYLRLFLTRSRQVDDTLATGFPSDATGNRLIVKSYKRNVLLRCDVKDGVAKWVDITPIKEQHPASRDYWDWSWQAFSERYGYPYICEVFSKRLLFASTNTQPQTLWFSWTDDITNFAKGTADDTAMIITPLTTTQNPICWLKPRGRQIMMGTSEAEYIIGPNSGSAGFSNATANITDHGYVGSDDVAAQGANDKLLYVGRGGGRIWTFEYSLEIDGWRSSDVSVFAPHIARDHGGFKRASLIKKPDTVVLYVLGDGQLALCVYNAMQEIRAWHRWKTEGRIMEVCGMANGSKNDKVYMVVDRAEGAFIEVVDEQSGYTDNGERDYVSLMETTPLNNFLEAYVKKKLQPVAKVFIGEPFMLDDSNLEISLDGETWWLSDMPNGEVPKGWHPFVSTRNWEYEQTLSGRVKGEQGFNMLAIQA